MIQLHLTSWVLVLGADFVDNYARLVESRRAVEERAILGILVRYAPAAVADVARQGRAAIRFLDYNWSLNDRCSGC